MSSNLLGQNGLPQKSLNQFEAAHWDPVVMMEKKCSYSAGLLQYLQNKWLYQLTARWDTALNLEWKYPILADWKQQRRHGQDCICISAMFCLVRTPFSVWIASSNFQESMDVIQCPVEWPFGLVYWDDIVNFHDRRGIYIPGKNCSFTTQTIWHSMKPKEM